MLVPSPLALIMAGRGFLFADLAELPAHNPSAYERRLDQKCVFLYTSVSCAEGLLTQLLLASFLISSLAADKGLGDGILVHVVAVVLFRLGKPALPFI